MCYDICRNDLRRFAVSVLSAKEVRSMGFAVNNNSFGIHSGSYSAPDSRKKLEDDLKRLKVQRDDIEDKWSINDSAIYDEKVKRLEGRIDMLQKRLDRLKSDEKQDDGHCETCENRKYQDGSDDPGVSFKTAGKIDPANAEAVVRGHEYEHVNRNRAKAAREDREIVYQSVVIKHGICSECGDSYVAGGETTTVTRAARDERFEVGMKDSENGKLLNIMV